MYAKNAWKKYSQEDVKKVFDFCEIYKDYISEGKTEREIVAISVKALEEKGFVNVDSVSEIKAGDKLYSVNKGKNVIAFVIGKRPISDGLRILGAHIDSPRIDLKQNPLYEKDGFALLDTHYYGGIKKYQWVTIPLALHGVVCKKDGSVINVNIGESDSDPVVGISDLLIHLSADQMQKTAAKVIEGENLDVTVGNMPLSGEEKDAVKKNVMKILNEKYGFKEEDFLSAEIEVVPAGRSRDYGLDRSMIAGYGHDDRCCAFSSLYACLDVVEPEYTSCCILVDKEEVGSIGATGAQSKYFENCILDLLYLQTKDNASDRLLRKALTNSKMLSSDVSVGYDPLFSSVCEPKNSSYLGKGITFAKFTGRGGKSGCNDANPEFFAWVRNVMDEANVCYQTAELGRVDQGGGGTIAYIMANLNMEVVDAGMPVLNMHAPMEIISKADLYEAYLGYKAFLEAK